jgi:hypothetical protein
LAWVRRIGARAGVPAAAALVCALSAHAHIVYGAKTLHGLVAEADLVLHVRIAAADVMVGASTELGAQVRPGVEAEVLGVLKGAYGRPRVRFAQHGHGVVRFEPGRETLLFLIDIARSRELRAVREAGLYEWVSIQEESDEYPLEPPARERVLSAARAYVSADAAATPALREAALRRTTRDLLTSGDADLAASALRDLVLAPAAPLLSAGDLPALLPLLDDPGTSMGVRASLLAELERRRLLDGAPHWLRLLDGGAPTRDRVTAIRAAAASSSSSPVRTRLIALVSDRDEEVAAAAASAIGRPGDTAAVPPLAAALAGDSARVRMAAIRGLSRIAAPDAVRVLEEAAASHPDAATRRRAAAELRKRGALPSAG